ncbi:MAG: alanine--tRNA ligase [Candidatus Pacebacteria bacterium]|nr:alanine--tRNA ligase [Candidatus Paceibacterota bacterium]
MNSNEVRQKFLNFFSERGHAILPSASLVPENDPSALFTTAGVQPLVPYILQGSHPEGSRLASVQKCVRTTDIDDVGDKTHATFFEMLGNWSIGDYFKEDAIKWSYELLTKEFGLDPERLYITVYRGDEEVPKDTESVEFWKSVGVPENRIYPLGDANFWPKPKKDDDYSGPCGPSTEMFYDLTEEGLGDLTQEEFEKADEDQKVVEIWNDVFMEYRKENGNVIEKLPKQNVDTGSGLERLLTILQKKDNIFETDVFADLIAKTKDITLNERSARIVADHIRTSIFMIADGVKPSNTDKGYVLRRLLRRAIFHTKNKNLGEDDSNTLVDIVYNTYKDQYDLGDIPNIKKEIREESSKFEKTIEKGVREFEKIDGDISGEEAFTLFASYGFPVEMTMELAKEKSISVDIDGYMAELEKHQEKSRTASSGKFKGGLGGRSEEELKYHTATHLLNAALREILGEHVQQKGSNINPERLRFDFSHSEKLTDEQKLQIEDLVNKWIEADLPVSFEEVDLEKAKKIGALGVFGDRYKNRVKVYSIGSVSKEICGGPHVERTSLLGKFEIKKEEASSAGVRRIKAVLV